MSDTTPAKAVVLLSGGLDSTTLLAVARDRGYACNCLTVRYGQRHAIEIGAAQRVAQAFGAVDHAIIDLDLRRFGGSALTADIAVPKDTPREDIGNTIPPTYVPARNTVFLSLALAYAESIGALDIFIGVNAIDYSGYPDCRPEFIRAFEALANLATRVGTEDGLSFRIHTPLAHLTKSEIIEQGARLGVDYSLTSSCYDPDELGRACGRCDACILRKQGFEAAGLTDPIPYQSMSSR